MNVNKAASYIEECEDGWYRVVRSDSVNSLADISLAGFASLDGSTDWYFNGWKLEPNYIATSYAELPRKREFATIPDIARYLDEEKGSLEMILTPISGHDVIGKSYGFQDLSCYSSGGFIIRRSRNRIGEVELVLTSGGTIYRELDVGWKSGQEMKYRLDWNKEKNESIFTVDDIHQAYLPTLKIPNGGLDIGHRNMGHSSGNAIYKSIVIRNRTGETVFKL